jgi:hypothetical protein
VRNDPTKRISRLFSLLTLAKEEKKVKTKEVSKTPAIFKDSPYNKNEHVTAADHEAKSSHN